MENQQNKNPLHGITLETIITHLVAYYEWEGLGERINIRCFTYDPSVKSSLKFLRKTPWARQKVEELYVRKQEKIMKFLLTGNKPNPPSPKIP